MTGPASSGPRGVLHTVGTVLWWLFLGALAGAVCGATWRLYTLIAAGYSPDRFGASTLLFHVLRIQEWAVVGALLAIAVALGERLVRLAVRVCGDLFRREQLVVQPVVDPTSAVRQELAARADAWLEQHREDDRPSHEHVITARDGTLTYRVWAWRALGTEELREVVWQALQEGRLAEPEPGGTVELVTDLGRDGT